MKTETSLSEDAPDWVALFYLPIAKQAVMTIPFAGKSLIAGGNALMWWDI
jgi:hypothetical protein